MAARLEHSIRSSGRRGWRGPVSDARGRVRSGLGRSTAGAGFGILADPARGVRGATKFLPTVLVTSVASRVRTPPFRLTDNGLFVGTRRPLRYEQRELRACAGELQGLRGNGGFVCVRALRQCSNVRGEIAFAPQLPPGQGRVSRPASRGGAPPPLPALRQRSKARGGIALAAAILRASRGEFPLRRPARPV